MDQKVEFYDFIEYSLKCLKLAGIDPIRDKSENSIRSKLMKSYHVFFIASLVAILPMSVISVINNSEDVQILTRVIPLFMFSIISLSKFFAITFNQKAFKTMVEKCERIFLIIDKENLKIKILHELRQFKRIEKACGRMGIIALSIFLIAFFAGMISTGNLIQKFPIELWYPFDEYNPLVYGFVLLWVITMTTVFVLAMIGIDFIIFSVITVVSIEYDHLCNQLKTLHQAPVENIKIIIQMHQDLIDICNTLEEIFSLSLLLNFLGISIIICDYGFQAIDGVNMEYSIKYTVLSCVALTQILMPCYFGSKLMDASEKASAAIYESGWNEINNNAFKHIILMITMRSHKPCVLTALKFTRISLKAFGSVSFILKSSR